MFAISNAKYTKKLKVNDIFTLAKTVQLPLDQEAVFDVPKFGTLRLQSLDIFSVAQAVNNTVTDCYGHVYFEDANSACVTPNHKQLRGNALTGFATSIENCSVTVQFQEYAVLQRSALLFPDPWGQPFRCMLSRTSAIYICAFPEDGIVQAAPDYTITIYSTTSAGSSNAEVIFVAVLCVAAFAVLLPHSKNTTKLATASTHLCSYCAPQLHSTIQEVVLADVTFAAAWSTCALAAYSGVASLLHPNVHVVLSTQNVQYVAFGVFLMYIFNAAYVIVSVMTKQIRPMFRLAYESTFLFTVAFMIPYNVAPLFHALFQFCTAATIVFVAFRDASFVGNAGTTATLHVLGTTFASIALLLPLLIDCDAVAATAEIPVLATAFINIASAGAAMALQ